MKYELTILIILSFHLSMAQDFPINDKANEIEFVQIVDVPDTDKNELFVRANQWLNKTFVSSKEVRQYSDKEAGEVNGNGNIQLITKMMGMNVDCGLVRFSIEIVSKTINIVL